MANLSWADLFLSGSLIDLDISFWDGLVRLRPEDLGVHRTEDVKTALTFGHERLVSKGHLKALRDLAYEARKLVTENSVTFRLVPGARYLPKSRRASIDRRLEDIRERFGAAVEKFCHEYPSYQEAMRGILRRAITDAAKHEDVVEVTLQRLAGQYPTVEKLRAAFAISWKIFSIAAPQDGEGTGDEGSSVTEAVRDMIKELRAEVATKTKDLLSLVAKGGKLTEKTWRSARAVCDRLESMNVFGDEALSAAITRLRNVVAQAAQRDDAGDVIAEGLSTVEADLNKNIEEAAAAAADRLTGRNMRRMRA